MGMLLFTHKTFVLVLFIHVAVLCSVDLICLFSFIIETVQVTEGLATEYMLVSTTLVYVHIGIFIFNIHYVITT